ncbi:integrin alpha-9 isoform X3 [Cryptotermes secundus]|uniref:integrin alpha-9 isoform X3 n=1 Tax=Cryptotermes secundus TaxID=105785 RepID=UPI000CD7C8E4|nr:integrin alpha-9 isoform X3 [Cryptotermes secundus]
MFLLFTLLVTSILLLSSHGFNLDTNHPIMYEDPLKGTGARGSYFGFTVLLHSGIKPWVQIGAPRGNDTKLYPGVIEPGVVFRCPIAESCDAVKFDTAQNEKEYGKGKLKYQEQKNAAWIGGAMDIREEEGDVVVCGHRWRNTYKRTSIDFMIGVCYCSKIEQNISSANGVYKLLPLLNQDMYTALVNKQHVANYAVGQAGMSVHFPSHKPQNRSELLIGAPGVYLSRGASIHYAVFQATDWSVTEQDTVNIRGFSKMKYFGYQVSSGEFFHGKRFYVASGPQGADNKGSVYIYRKEVGVPYMVKKTLVGEKVGEFFGGSLAVADVNGDGLDDLIVGAPMYTISHDEGRIYVFIANSQSTMFSKAQKIDGRNQGARFGTAVVAVGDLDKDKFADIAVGAPYENGNIGSIYIYSGSTLGLTLTQKIMAQDISSNLRGFGISIARGADIDMNKYVDIAVGAFQSGHVVLFRAYPVVYFQTTVHTDVHQLHGNETYFNITVCLSYIGKDVPSSLNVTREIILDEKLHRASISGVNKPYRHSVIVPDSGRCEAFRIYLKRAHLEQHLLEPISIRVSQKLIRSEEIKTLLLVGRNISQEQDTFKKYIPVVNEKQSISHMQINIPFATGCGEDNICISELHLKSSFSSLISGTFVIGSKSELELKIGLVNTGEPAYMAGVNITIPFPVELAKGHMDCQESSLLHGLQLNCYLGNPLRSGNQKELTVHLDMSGVKVGTEYLTFNISAYTKSKDKNLHENFQQLHLNLTTDANISILGKSEEDVYSYFKANEMKFKQIYEVQKVGLSSVDVAEIDISIPVQWFEPNRKKINLLELYSPKAYLNGQPLSCSSSIRFHSEDDVQDEDILDDESKPDMQNQESQETRDLSKIQNEAKGYQPPANRTLFLNCSTPNVVCNTVKCTAGPFESTPQSSAVIAIMMTLKISDLGTLMGKKDIVHLTTSGSVTIKKPENLNFIAGNHSVTVSSIFIGNVQKEVVATWIIALAIIAGILLLMLLVIGLMKAGFFERRKKEELKALKAVDE